MNKLYPVFLKIEGKKCLVIGGGIVAFRRIKELIECGAVVTAVAPRFSPGIVEIWKRFPDRINLKFKNYSPDDLDEKFTLVIISTDSDELNSMIYRDAIKKDMLVNVVDEPKLCSFHTPAVFKCGDLKIAISTNGRSPLLARIIKEKLYEIFDDRYKFLLILLGKLRDKLKVEISDPGRRAEILEEVIENRDVWNIDSEDKVDRILDKIMSDFKLSYLI
jgi:siroheme synthase-like protein